MLSYLNLEHIIESEGKSSIALNYDYSSDECYIPPTHIESDNDILSDNGS